MKVGLVDVDSHNFPNLCLMKISSFHKNNGDDVEFWKPDSIYDRVYVSKVFTESVIPVIQNAKEVFLGGSGIDYENKLPYCIEHETPDYTLYPQYDFALGMLTRGCPRKNHGFRITPKKDGCISKKVCDLDEFWKGQKKIVSLDQNILACRDKYSLLEQLALSHAEVEFNGGLDVRFMSDTVIEVMKRIKVKDYHFAWDDPKENLIPNFYKVVSSGLVKPDTTGVYVLTNYWSTIQEDLYRIYELRKMKLLPFVMIYDKQKFVDKRGRWLKDVHTKFTREQLIHFKIVQHLQRWCGNRRLIKSIPNFEDYEPYAKWKAKGFPVPGYEAAYSLCESEVENESL